MRLNAEQLAVMERAAIVGDPTVYSGYGYMIDEDGTCYALAHQFYHGIVLAILYPDMVDRYHAENLKTEDTEGARSGVTQLRTMAEYEASELNVFDYQDFELWSHDMLPVVRISIGGMLHSFTLDIPVNGANEKQIETTRLIFTKAQSCKLDTIIFTEHKEMSLRRTLEVMKLNSEQLMQEIFGKDNAETDEAPVTFASVGATKRKRRGSE